MANSAQMVFPLPVGAPTNTLSSLLYTVLNTGGQQSSGENMGEEEILRPLLRTEATRRNSASQPTLRCHHGGCHRSLYLQSAYHIPPPPSPHTQVAREEHGPRVWAAWRFAGWQNPVLVCQSSQGPGRRTERNWLLFSAPPTLSSSPWKQSTKEQGKAYISALRLVKVQVLFIRWFSGGASPCRVSSSAQQVQTVLSPTENPSWDQ